MTPHKPQPRSWNALAIVPDAYGGLGGIARVAEDVLDIVAQEPGIERIVVLPRRRPTQTPCPPTQVEMDLSATAGVKSYLGAILRHSRPGAFDLIYCAHLNLAPFAWLAARLNRCPWILALHGYEAWQPGRRLSSWAASRADSIWSVSRLTAERFQAWSKMPWDRIEVVPNSVRIDRFAPGPKSPYLLERYELAGKKVIMTLGRLDANEKAKGFDRIVEILPDLIAHVPNIAYLICGDGSDTARIRALAQERGVLDRVVFAGLIDEAEKADHFRLADLYAMPSELEGFGLVFIEALASGIPVIASAIDGGREAVLDGQLGQVVDPFDRDALIKAVMRALDQPRVVQPGIAYFGFAAYADRIRAALKRALSGNAESESRVA